MEKHYICTGGCQGVSDRPGVCQTSGCPKHNQPLQECDCVDGEHGGVAGVAESFSDEEED